MSLQEANGFITGYIVRYDSSSSRRKRALTVKVVDKKNSNIIIGGLGHTESYSITISARTSAGEGLISEPIMVKGKIFQISVYSTLSMDTY